MKGYTVVDAATVLITHLGEVLRKYASELLSREDMQKLLDRVKEHAPTVVDELKPDVIRMGELHQILVLLLQERVPLTNLTKILETVVQAAPHVKSPLDLADRVRQQLGRDILDRLRDDHGKVAVAIFEPKLEMKLRERLRERQLLLAHEPLERLVTSVNQRWEKSQLNGREIILLTDGELRRPLRTAIERALPELTVAAYTEVPSDITIDITDVIKLEDVFRVDTAEREGTRSGTASPVYAAAVA